jgi:CheY-like chemotaxis protein
MIHVLLIEDNPGDVLMIREALRTLQLAAETTVVYDGQQALALLNSGFRPDLVVLDLNIPRCDGLEVLKRWKTGIRPPVIVFSNSGDNVITDREAELGVREHIGKPSDVGKYMTVIGGALGRWMAPR